MLGFLFISFTAGILTGLAPCILPLLPVIIGGSVAEGTNTRRALVIISSLGISVFLFTLLLKASTFLIVIPPSFWQFLSGGLLLLFGIATVAPLFWEKIPGVSQLYRASNQLLGSGYQKQTIGGDAIVGAALGPVFSSCSPTYFVILASVLPADLIKGTGYLLAYIIGLCIFLLSVSLLGQRIMKWLGIASDPHGWFKKTIGAIFIVIGVLVLFGFDKKIEAALPAGTFGEVIIEQHLLSLNQSGTSVASSSQELKNQPIVSTKDSLTMAEKALRYPKAPELVHPDGFINTNGEAISLSQYLGKSVVLIDFWDYSCINCQRTFPYLTLWYQKYKDQGLVIIGVHTPEFAFERLKSNVAAAAERFNLTYPIVLDNEYETWNAFQNQYWPREYLVDIDGFIVHDHAGEGSYDETEQAIQQALRERARRLGGGGIATSTLSIQNPDLSAIQSPETYFGSNRNEYLGNGIPGVSEKRAFTLPNQLKPNTLYLGETWNVTPEYAESVSGSSVEFEYSAHDVYLVGTAKTAARIRVLRDGKPVGDFGGADVDPATSEVLIQEDRLYKLVHDPTPGVHVIEIQVEAGTLHAYTLTFG